LQSQSDAAAKEALLAAKGHSMTKLDITKIHTLIEMAIAEDLGSGDVTSELLFKEGDKAQAHIVAREELIVSGMDVVQAILTHYDERLSLDVHLDDGEWVPSNGRLATVKGPLMTMLSAERVVLNFLQRLCAIATTTCRYVQAVEGSGVRIYDTRKTIPGWRLLDKYAVRCGGGHNHRIGLYDGILVKDNHLAESCRDLQGKLQAVVAKARDLRQVTFVAVEVDNVDDQLNCVLRVPGVDVVLLDNMNLEQLRRAVELRNTLRGQHTGPLLEASGGITLNTVATVAETGIDRIAIGALTHSAEAVDIGLDR
jgi:nicotinate-nucleotide pyrophosphorylase (carboxylating)